MKAIVAPPYEREAPACQIGAHLRPIERGAPVKPKGASQWERGAPVRSIGAPLMSDGQRGGHMEKRGASMRKTGSWVVRESFV